ncbi:MAG: hypothetical protein JJ939_05175 [Alphaproteobacteria bacterium]|nr:hypothetical protein [Rhodobiaceae bacterium]MBO6544088.1 hypothetical protein [Alphaproteobacteria bacterium]MBO6627798.1 hypothetical protein [Alphaproteobacteria bacterium]
MLKRLAQVHHVACIILKGAGKSFSAGHDLKDIQKGERRPVPISRHEPYRRWPICPSPSSPVSVGIGYTGRLELALGSDIIIASRPAKFADTHSKWGLSPL